jgi:hypothetical protein
VTLSTRKATRVFLAALLLVVAVGVLLTVSAHSGSAAGPAAPSTQVLAKFGIFDRSSSAVDTLPADAGPEAAAAPLSRGIATRTGGLSQWATLNGKQACVVIDGSAPAAQGGPSACANLEAASDASELLTIAASASEKPNTRAGEAQIVAGLAPNGVDAVNITLANGAEHTVPVVENGFHLLTGGSNPVSYEWTDGSGAKHVQNMKGS